MNSNCSIIPIILSGGKGTRLWPLSRESFPKQYQSIIKNNQKSLLQITQERISEIPNILDPIIICNEEHRFIVAEQMREINVKPLSILLEPIPRNTAPAVTVATLKALEHKKDPLLLFLPADHLIKNKSKFTECINAAVNYTKKGRIVTFGVCPTHPETGYGYIEAKNFSSDELLSGYEISSFIEKPKIEKAKKLIKNKRFSWNSGIFLFKANTFLNEIKKFSPEMICNCEKSIKNSNLDLDFQRIEKKAFTSCENISIDKAIMEKTNLGTVIPLSAGWSDIGNWESLWQSEEKDVHGNVIHGKVIGKDSKNCYWRSENKLLVGIGLEDIVVVDTRDAILVANKRFSQEVKDIVEELNKNQFPESKMHKKIYRPWGHFTSIETGQRWQIKKLVVNPGASLSLQMHNHRSEHWIVVEGRAHVEINDKKQFLEINQSIDIPLGAKHRLSNLEDNPLAIIEVQSGSYLSEEDIIRFEDAYGRNAK